MSTTKNLRTMSLCSLNTKRKLYSVTVASAMNNKRTYLGKLVRLDGWDHLILVMPQCPNEQDGEFDKTKPSSLEAIWQGGRSGKSVGIWAQGWRVGSALCREIVNKARSKKQIKLQWLPR